MNFRKQVPPIQLPTNIVLKKPNIFTLDNGIEVHNIESGTHEVLLVEMCFKAGRWYEDKPQLSHFTHSQIKEGTYKLSSKQIAEKLEYYGATLKVFVGFDYCTISVSTISRFLDDVLAIIREILEGAMFPEQELNIYRNNVLEEFKINRTKHDYIATKTFGLKMFGENHAYGYPTRESDMQSLSVEDLKAYFKKQYCPKNAVIFMAGYANFNVQSIINKHLGTWQNTKGITSIDKQQIANTNFSETKIQDKKAHQVSLRIGLPIISRSDNDYLEFYVLTTILGGYFGSRLMTNIREDKGYTYGIYALIVNMVHGSYMYINTEVGKQVWKPCLNEIYTEIERLENELVGEQELLMVKNYLLGYLLNLIDGGFNRLANYKELYFQGLKAEYFNNFAQQISTVTPEAIRQMAQQSFGSKNFVKVIVGDIKE